MTTLLLCAPLWASEVHLTVTTPGRAPQTLADVPASIEVVIPEQLKELPGTTLDEKLAALVPGLSTTRSSGDINNRMAALTMRGLGSSPQGGQSQGRTLILLDGVPLNNSANGGVNWNELTIEDIDHIEVFKGPSSSLYGSSAIGGTINIITRGAKKGYSLETSYGTYSTLDTTAKAGAKAGSLSLEVFGKHLESDGYVQAIEANRTQYTAKSYINENSFGAKAAYEFKEMGVVRADFSRYNGVTGMGTNYQRTAKGEYRESETDLARISWKGSREGLNWNVAVYGQQTGQARAEATATTSHTDIEVDRRDHGVQSSMAKDIAGLTYTLGFDWKHGDVNGYDNYNNGTHAKDIGEIDNYAPFIQLKKNLLSDKVNIVGGLRYDIVKFHDGFAENTKATGFYTGELDGHTWHSLTPKISAGYKYTDTVQQYISYARGFRAGELEDTVLTLIKGSGANKWYQKPNPNLGPEKADTVETGFRLNPVSAIYIDLSVYYTTAKDFIYQVETGVTDPTWGKERIYANIGEVEVYGLELPVKYIAGDFAASAAYAQSRSKITEAPGLTIKGNQLTYAPRHIYSAGLSWKHKDTNVFTSWTHKGKQFTNDANTGASAGYSVMNIGAAQQITKKISASLRLGNIFNERYQQAEDTLAPGRTVTAAVKVLF